MYCHWTCQGDEPKLRAMECIIIGAGVAGLTQAWMLARDGWRVTVVDAARGAGRGASFANGGQLSYGFVAPLATPAVLARLPGWLLDPDAPVRFRPRLDPAQWRWILGFLSACTERQSRTTTLRLLALAALSRQLLHAMMEEECFAFDHARRGKLVIHTQEAGIAEARAQLLVQAGHGPQQEVLDAAGCFAAEPALRIAEPNLVGGILTPDEESGDCHAFCVGLAAALERRHGVRFLWATRVQHLIATNGRVLAAMADDGPLEADAYVVAAGAEVAPLLAGIGLDAPLQPLKGYSLTVPVTEARAAPRMSVTDASRKIVYARIGDRLRIAGMADLAGSDHQLAPRRLSRLTADARTLFPRASDWSRLSPWSGLRAATPTSAPILGVAPGHANLMLNLGLGALGFTLAAGAARLVADTLGCRATALPMAGFAPADHGMV